MEFLVFGDQTADQYPILRDVCRLKSNRILQSFLERSAAALRDEVQRLPPKWRAAIPDFVTISQLVDTYNDSGVKVPQLESCIVTIAQLSHFLDCFVETRVNWPEPGHSHILGICTGLLAASAVASSHSPHDFLELAVEIVRIAFRVGTCVGDLRDALEQPSDEDGPTWATKVTGISESSARSVLAEFHATHGIPLCAQAYVTAVSAMTLTIGGPPSTTKRLFQKSAFSSLSKVSIPVYAPYHTAYLYQDADIDTILDERSRETLKAFRPIVDLHSASTGKCYSAPDSLELLRDVLADILLHPVRWDRIIEECQECASVASDASFSVSSFGVTNLLHSLVSALKVTGKSPISVTDHTSRTLQPFKEDRTPKRDKIAIIGMAGRFPGAADHEALWELLENGLDVHREVPSDRFDAQAHYDPLGKGRNKSHTPFGCFIEEPGRFDPRFFNMSPREAAQTDPMGRLALVTAYEALEMSGYVPNRTPSTKLDRIGTFYGQTSDDWREINAAEDIDTYFITGGVRAFGAGRINYYFKFSGPSYSVDTACSSSLAAVQIACLSLWSGECDTACAGGLNVLTNPDIFSGLSKGQFLSKTGGCKTFDDGADGYCRGDACGTVILKRYQDAVADKDNILGCILSTATNHSAEAVSITHPHAGTQEILYKKVLAEAGLDANDVSYIEMHGTGTQAGDAVEMSSVTNVFAPRNRLRTSTLNLGAIKANIGHGEAASGLSALVKVLMMLQRNAIPPNVGIKTVMNHNFPTDLERRKVNIATKLTPFPRRGTEKRRVLVNNFSAAGGNTAIILEDAPLSQRPTTQDPRSTHIVTVSARSIASLKRNIQRLSSHVDRNPTIDLSSLSYTSTARRIQHPYRVAFTVSDIREVSKALDAQIKESYSPCSMVPTKVVFAFTGQGSQYPALGKQLYEDLPTFRSDIERLDNLACLQGFSSFLPLLSGDADINSLSPVIVQLGISCIQVALARMWQSWGVTPVAVIGHSLGEYAALHIAGVISASDMVFLVGRRAQLLESHCTKYTHGMLAVKGSVDAVSTALGDKMMEIACVNGPQEMVLCGRSAAVDTAQSILTSRGFKSTRLEVPFAFHSGQVDPILEPFAEAASAVVFYKPAIPVLSPLSREVISESGIIGPQYLCRHAREMVDFYTALSAGQDRGIFDEKTVWVEIGPHPVCLGMVKSSLPGQRITAPSLRRNEDPWRTLASSICTLYLAGISINFNEYHRYFNHAQELLILPTYSFDEKTYWLDYHNNWTLTKGQILPAPVPTAEPVEEKPKLSTTSCQRLVREELNGNTGTIVVQSDLAETKLHAVVSGHVVNNAPLCPSSLYGDMAMTVANYLYEQLRPGAPPVGLNVCSMEVHKTLIAEIPPPPEGQHLQLEATADLDRMRVDLLFRSVTPEGRTIQDLGHGLVRYEDMEIWREQWSRIQYLVKSRVDQLTGPSSSANKILRGLAYKLFQALVTYAPKYRGMEEVVMDSTTTEATAKVRFQTTDADGEFFCSPFWIDSLAHLSGFILNGSDVIDSSQNVYISNGWSSIKISRPLSDKKEYRSYVKMQEQAQGNIAIGDVYIFEDEEIIGVVSGLKFQRVPRRALDVMVPPTKKTDRKALPNKVPPKPAAKPNSLRIAEKQTTVTTKQSSKFNELAIAPGFVKTTTLKTTKTTELPPVSVQAHGSGSIVAQVMDIIADETDLDMSELVDDAVFENLGVDSLLSLTILARLREDLEMDIDPNLFTDYPSIGQLKGYFAKKDKSTALLLEPPVFVEHSDSSSPSMTPSDDYDVLGNHETSPSSGLSVGSEEDFNMRKMDDSDDGAPSIVRQIVAEEMGMSISEIPEDADLAQLGMDSLMSLTMLSALRERTAIDLPSSFLIQNACIREMEEALGMRRQPKIQPLVQAQAPPPQIRHMKRISLVTEHFNHSSTTTTIVDETIQYPPATSVLLQGNAKTATQRVFLFPDGSGSATSYISIPNLGPQVAIFGMNCPFMKTPADFVCGIQGVSSLYINEMKRRQPQGPYIIGGWSAGGVIAYEVAAQLYAMGESVDRLLLMDSPCPINLDPLPARLHHFFDSIGLLGTGTGRTPAWLLPHFESSIKALEEYKPQQLPRSGTPRTFAIWATDGVCGKPGDPRPPPGEEEDPKPMKWLLNNRTDFGDNGWGQLLGTENMEFSTIRANHFTMMRESHAQELGEWFRMALRP